MRFLSFLYINHCFTCKHFTPFYYDNTMELSTCKKFNGQYADMCRMDEGKCGKQARHFSPNKDKEKEKERISELAK